MSDMFCIASTTEVALVGATPKTVIQLLAPANHRVKLKSWGVFFDGVSATAEPVQVRLVRQTSAGTMSALTPVQISPVAETVLTTAQMTATVEPTSTDVIDVVEVHPQSGYEVIFSSGDEVIVGGAGRIGIECTAPAAVNVRAKMRFEE